MPYSEGGLGLRDLLSWNKTLSLKLIWLPHTENESLWASWSKKHRLKGASIWILDESKQSSWIWKAILKLRPLAENFIRSEVGNGQTASFWYDYWLPIGPLIKFFGSTGPRQLRVPLSANVSDSCNANGWIMRPARSSAAETLHVLLCFVSSSTENDTYSWYVEDSQVTSFSTSHTWELIREQDDRVDWDSTVWFSGHVPRHAFHMWMTNLDNLLIVFLKT